MFSGSWQLKTPNMQNRGVRIALVLTSFSCHGHAMTTTPDRIGTPTAALSTRVVWGLLMGVFAIGSQSFLLSPVLKDVAASLQVSERQAAYAFAAYAISVAIFAPVIGLVGDLFSRRLVLLAGLGTFAIGSLAGALAQGLWQLLAAQAVCGIGAGAFLPSTYAFVGDEVAYADRAKVMGRVMSGWAAALALGVPLGGIVGEGIGWRGALALVTSLALAAVLLLIQLPSRRERAIRRRQLLPGLTEAVVEVTRATGLPWLLAINLLNTASFYGVFAFLGSFLRDRLDIGSGIAGLFVVAYGVGVGATTLNAQVFDRIGKQKAALIGLIGVATVVALLPQASVAGWVGLALVLVLWGVLQSTCMVNIVTLVTQQSETARGVITALLSCSTYLGFAIGSGSMGLVYERLGFGAVGLSCAAMDLAGAALLWRARSRTHPV